MPMPGGGTLFVPPGQPAAGGPRFQHKRLSVAVLLIFALVVVATLLLVGMGLFTHYQDREQERAKLSQQIVTDVDQLAAGLSLPLWNFDYSQVAKILDSSMQDRNVCGIIVTQADPANPDRSVTYLRARDAKWRVLEAKPDESSSGLLSQERDIVAMGEPIGRLKMLVTTRFMDQELQNRLAFTLLLSIVFDLLLIVSVYLLLWQLILRPLRSIERFALAVKAGGPEPEGAGVGGFRGELESLRHSIGDMVALLQSRLGALREKETTLRAVLNSVPQAIYWKDAQGRYLGCNTVFAAAAGLPNPEAIMGKVDLELPFQDEDLTIHQRDDQDVLRTGEPKIHVIECLTLSGNRTIWLDITKVPILDAEGKPSAVLGVFEDITERRAAEEERNRLQEQLNQSQKLESIGRLAGGVAHDNNNMLTAILMHAELLRELLGSEHPALRHIKSMEGAAERSAGLIRQLLAFSRRQVIEPKILDLNQLLDGFRKSMAPLIGEDVAFELKLGPELWKVRMDPAQVDQIVMNLVVNARDAMPRGGTLSIETCNVSIDADYCLENPGSSPGDYVVLTVSDTGIGMSADVRQKIFEPFFTTKELGKGTGLGLSTVFGIVKQNNGFINVYSEKGLGATFRVYLPRSLEEKEPEVAEEQVVRTQGKGHILVVEDDEVLREVIPRILGRLGYSFTLAATPGDALQICYNQDLGIDLLLTDVVMPGMSGKELWEQVAPIRPGMKVIYMSGYTADVISRQGVLDDGVQFIQKPFSTSDLGRKLKSVLGG